MADSNFNLDSTQEESNLINFFRTRSKVSAYLLSVRDTSVNWIGGSGAPAWFDTLQGELTALQNDQLEWSSSIASGMTAIPQNYIDFSNSFGGQMVVLQKVIGQLITNPQQPGTALDAINTIFDAFIKQAQDTEAKLFSADATLRTFLEKLGAEIRALQICADTAADALGAEQSKVAQLKDKIRTLKAQLELDLAALKAADIGQESALVALVVALIVLPIEPAIGAAATALVATVGLGAANTTGVLAQDSVIQDQQEIVAAQSELSTDSKQVLALQGVTETCNGLLDAYSKASFNTGALRSTWTTLADNLMSVRDLAIADRGFNDGLKGILADLQDFQGTLQRMTAYCTKLQEQALDSDNTTLQLLTIPKANAA